MDNRRSYQRPWPYVRNALLFFVAGTPAMIAAASLLWVMGQYSPWSYRQFLIHEAKQAYLISAYHGPLLSGIHTYLLRHAQAPAVAARVWRSLGYATLLGLVLTVSLFPFVPSGYDAVLYVLFGTLTYGAAAGRLGVAPCPRLPLAHAVRRPVPAIGVYLRNAVLFVAISAAVRTAVLGLGLKIGLISENYFPRQNSEVMFWYHIFGVGAYYFAALALCLSIAHTLFLFHLTLSHPVTRRGRSVWLACALTFLATIVFLVLGELEWILFMISASVYGWLAGPRPHRAAADQVGSGGAPEV